MTPSGPHVAGSRSLLPIRSILTALVLFLGAALLVAVAVHLQAVREEGRTAERFASSDAVRAQLLATVVTLAQERGWTYTALRGPDPVGGEVGRRTRELRQRSDDQLNGALAALAKVDLARLVSESALSSIPDQQGTVRQLRAQADTALGRPRTDRVPELAGEWFTAMTALIRTVSDIRFDLLRALPTGDKTLADHSFLKHFVSLASEQAGQMGTLLAGALAEQRPPTDAEFAAIAASDAQIGLAWQMIRDIARSGMPPEIVQAVAAAEGAYFDRLMGLRERVYGATRLGSPYPVSAEEWFARASEAIGALTGVQAASVRDTAEHTAALVGQARSDLVLWSAFGVLGTLAVAVSLAVLTAWVLRPLRMVTATMARLAEGDLDVEVPRYRRRDEIGAMVEALRTFKASALARQRLRAAKDRAERQASEAIREREARLRAIFEGVTDGIVNVDEAGRVEAMNPAALALFGHPPEEVARLRVADLVPEAERGKYERPLREYLETGSSGLLGVRQELLARRADGSTVPVEATVAETRLGGRRVLTATVRDITERREVERMKGEFIATVSHELRTPLTSIRGSLALLLGPPGGDLPVRVRSLAEMAHRNAERLIALVNDILDVERIEGGRLEFSFQPVDLVALVKDAIDANQSFAVERRVALRLGEGGPSSLRVSGDPARLQQVMANLLSNAAKFSEPGSEVVVTTEWLDGVARVVVHDQGPGVPEEFRRRIFQRFAQANSGDSRRQGGTGLGLSISKAIVERHGGRIGFESRPGDTRFFFTLPALDPPAASGSSEVGRRGRILVCENDPDAARLLRLVIEARDYTVDVAHTLADARRLIDERDYTGVTLDLVLPDGSGIDLIRDLCREERHRALPIVVISAVADEARQITNGDAVAVIGWLGKPLDERSLDAALGRITVKPAGGLPSVLHVQADHGKAELVAGSLEGRVALSRASSLAEARRRIEEGRFDVVMLDPALPDGSGPELLPVLRGGSSAAAVIILAGGGPDEDLGPRLEAALTAPRATDEELANRILDLVAADA